MKEYLQIIRHPNRPNTGDCIEYLFPEFIELCGDRLHGDDVAIIGGIAEYQKVPVTIIGQLKGRNMNEHVQYNFSMSHPEGYRKVLRLMKQAEKFKRPIICFVDTLGAYPGKEAEENGQAVAIGNCLMEVMHLKTPIISILLGDGGSGGALVLCVSDVLISLEHATLSVISPKACAGILWRDPSRDDDAAEMLKITSKYLCKLGIVDRIIREPRGGAHVNSEEMLKMLKLCIDDEIKKVRRMSVKKLVKKRIKKFNNIGKEFICKEY